MVGAGAHEQLRRQWRTYLKYQREFTPAEAIELRDTVGELLAEAVDVKQLRSDVEHLERQVEDYELDRELDTTREELEGTIDEMAKEQSQRLAEFAELAEDLHHQAHGSGSFLMCTAEPCWRMYRILPTGREVASR